MKIRKRVAALVLAPVLALTACGVAAVDSTSASSADSSTSTAATDTAASAGDTRGDSRGGGGGGGGGGGVDVSSVSTEDDLVALLEEAYGDGGLDLHRGHQPIQDVLDEVLGISHDELHVRMEEQGQNLAEVATDLGVDPQTLIDALVDAWTPAVDNAVTAGAITEAEAEAYRQALVDAFTFRVTWNGEDAMPAVAALDA